MHQGKKVVVNKPAYNPALTLKKTYEEVVAHDCVDRVILVDDASTDATAEVAREFEKLKYFAHPENRGYGGNQKTCYRLALDEGADIVVMVHPDYQYTPKLIPTLVGMVGSELYPCVLASRILGGGALKGGMPLWKYFANRGLTFVQNLLLGAKLSEYHTGYRAFSREVLESIPLDDNSDDFVFDGQMLAQVLWWGFTIGEVSCPTKYFPEASSINFSRSVTYGLGCLRTALLFRLAKWGLRPDPAFPDPAGHPRP
jgi:glycosyltransferase involved in cell wall biosynthesis